MSAGGTRSSVPSIGRAASILAFGMVGAAAACVHFTIVSLLVPLGTHPLVANVAGFLVAFAVSFSGHRRWTFPGTGRARPKALHRFFIVAATSFALNESLYAVLLRFTELGYRPALIIVLLVVAVSTFVTSKYWAFADERE
jgi:putative flippase GtrA